MTAYARAQEKQTGKRCYRLLPATDVLTGNAMQALSTTKDADNDGAVVGLMGGVTITLHPLPPRPGDVPPEVRLRRALKVLGRTFGFRAEWGCLCGKNRGAALPTDAGVAHSAARVSMGATPSSFPATGRTPASGNDGCVRGSVAASRASPGGCFTAPAGLTEVVGSANIAEASNE
jgi:hypothetical protein